jgi:prepilin-type N-terminal cleavage/methylation domain-containing protein
MLASISHTKPSPQRPSGGCQSVKKLQGFTLIELVVVICIIAILSGGYALITYQPAPIELTAMATQLAGDLRYAQALSMTKGVRYRLASISSNQYQIVSSAGTAITFPSGSTTMTMGGGIYFNGASNLPYSLVAFDGWGTPYTDTANTLLAAAAVITLAAPDGTSQTVTVLPVTGRVSVP